MELKELTRAVRAGWWLLVVGLLCGTALGGLATLRATPMYASSTQLFVSTTGTDDTSTAYQGNLFSQQRVTSYVQLLTGQRVAARVIERLDLDETPGAFTGSLTASAIPETVLIQVTVMRPSPEEARDIAAAVGEEFGAIVSELETPDGAANSTVKVTVTEEPELAAAASSPSPQRNVALGGIVGLLLGAAGALVRNRLDTTVKSNEDISKAAGVAVVGALVEDEALRAKPVVSDEDGYSETGEAYRQIRTNLQFLDVDNPARSLVITSSLPGEGKTTVAVNLALVLAQSGARVMLIEADMRRPRVTRYLGMISGAGLSNVLAGNARLDELVQPFGDGRLTVLAAGPVPPNPSEMLGSHQMRALVAEAREWNDYVVIDAPPLLPVTDGAVLSTVADGAIIVARHGVTTGPQLDQAATALHRIEARLLGVILNRIPAKAAAGYGYGYSYAYHAAPEGELDGQPGSARNRGMRRPIIDHTTQFAAIRDDAPEELSRSRGR